MAEAVSRVPKRILANLLDSLAAGVVPRIGAPYVAIGREDEVSSLISSMEKASDGGSFMKLIIGRYGSGKSFLMQLTRGYALERGFVCCDADLSPERRFYGSRGNGLATYRELVKNMSTKTSPDGNALTSIIAKWISNTQSTVAGEGYQIGTAEFEKRMTEKIYQTTSETQSQVGGFDFACVINAYYKATVSLDDEKKSCACRWLRGEYTSKAEAKRELGTSSIINDENWYDYIKLITLFVRKIGYKGLIVFVDECVNLYKITNRVSRESNYEKLLSMFNDTLQGGCEGLGIILGGTPMFLEDKRRGLYSYEALKSRLEEGHFTSGEYKNLMGPVIRLERLTDDELYALVTRVRNLHAQYYSWNVPISDEQLEEFLKSVLEKTVSTSMMTPREIIRDLLGVLNILYQNKNASFGDIVKSSAKMNTDNKKESDDSLLEIEL